MPLHTETKKPDSVKKALPLFGKRGTYKYSTVPTESKLLNPIQQTDNKSDEEEMEENDEVEEIVKEATKTEETRAESIEKVATETDATETESTEKVVMPPTDEKKLDDEQTNKPSTSSRSIRKASKGSEKQQAPEIEIVPDRIAVPDADEENVKNIITNGNSSSSSSNATKKKRNRIRIRTDKGRENVDFDEEMVDTEKYSTWVPPQGQSGDGSTDLNEKYGY